MAGLVFFFEDNDRDVWSGRRIDLDAWNYAAKLSGDIDRIIVVNRTDEALTTFDASLDIQFTTAIPVLDGVTCQVVCPWNRVTSQSLWGFDHLVDWYLFGPAEGWVDDFFADKFIHIPQYDENATHSVLMVSTVMFHRHWTLH